MRRLSLRLCEIPRPRATRLTVHLRMPTARLSGGWSLPAKGAERRSAMVCPPPARAGVWDDAAVQGAAIVVEHGFVGLALVRVHMSDARNGIDQRQPQLLGLRVLSVPGREDKAPCSLKWNRGKTPGAVAVGMRLHACLGRRNHLGSCPDWSRCRGSGSTDCSAEHRQVVRLGGACSAGAGCGRVPPGLAPLLGGSLDGGEAQLGIDRREAAGAPGYGGVGRRVCWPPCD